MKFKENLSVIVFFSVFVVIPFLSIDLAMEWLFPSLEPWVSGWWVVAGAAVYLGYKIDDAKDTAANAQANIDFLQKDLDLANKEIEKIKESLDIW